MYLYVVSVIGTDLQIFMSYEFVYSSITAEFLEISRKNTKNQGDNLEPQVPGVEKSVLSTQLLKFMVA